MSAEIFHTPQETTPPSITVLSKIKNIGGAVAVAHDPFGQFQQKEGFVGFGFEEPCVIEPPLLHEAMDESSESPGGAVRVLCAEGLRVFKEPNGNWLNVAERLLNRINRAATTGKQRTYMSAAMLATCFSDNPAERVDFIDQVFAKGMQTVAQEACSNSGLLIMDPDTGMPLTLRQLAPMFKLKPEHARLYLDHQRGHKPCDAPTPRAALRTILEQLEESGEITPEAELDGIKASIAGENVGGLILDMRKVERYALYRYFLRRHMDTVLGDDVRQSPLAAELRRQRSSPARNSTAFGLHMEITELSKFREDIEQSFRSFSLELMRTFNDEDDATLSNEQRATRRFEAIIDELGAYEVLGRYIDNAEWEDRKKQPSFGLPADVTHNIFTLSESGGAVSEVMPEWFEAVLKVAAESPDANRITPEMIMAYLHGKRRQINRLAVTSIAELSAMAYEASQAKAVVNADGELQLTAGRQVPEMGSLGVAVAAVLDCPAAHVMHANRATLGQSEKRAHGSAHYIDHVLAIVITEAYERGLFDLTRDRGDVGY